MNHKNLRASRLLENMVGRGHCAWPLFLIKASGALKLGQIGNTPGCFSKFAFQTVLLPKDLFPWILPG